ncbi:hypothetical protein H8E88_31985 [candidate division KSB1 bacterium]|nr:hypothetical protein [candidate division KSB1 bacterium]
MQSLKLLFILIVTILLVSTCEEQNENNEKYLNKFNYEIVPFSELPTQEDADSTFYTYSRDYTLILSADSILLNKQLDSMFTIIINDDIDLQYGWYQPSQAHCGDLTYAPPPILVVKLNSVNSDIFNYNFSEGLSNFHNCPEMKYRRYKF